MSSDGDRIRNRLVQSLTYHRENNPNATEYTITNIDQDGRTMLWWTRWFSAFAFTGDIELRTIFNHTGYDALNNIGKPRDGSKAFGVLGGAGFATRAVGRVRGVYDGNLASTL
jgi:hypothetical protein